MPTKTLLIMRHAKAERDPKQWQDFDRPLSPRGERDCVSVSEFLRAQNLVPDTICASAAVRCAATAERLAKQLHFTGQILLRPELYSAGPPRYLKAISQFPVAINRLLLIGHNPGLEELIGQLCGEWITLPTAGIAQLSTDEVDWSQVERAEFQWVAAHTVKRRD